MNIKRTISKTAAVVLLGVPLAMFLGVAAFSVDVLGLGETSWTAPFIVVLGGASLAVSFGLLIVYGCADILTSNH